MNAIIVGTDGSDASARAVEWAADEAVRRRLRVRIVHAVAPWLYDTPVDQRFEAIRKWLLTTGEEVLDAAVAACRDRADSLTVEGELLPGPAAKALLERSAGARMVVLGGHGAGAATGLLLGSTTLQVVTHTKTPAIIVRHADPEVRGELVVGVDGSTASEPALAFAFEEAALRRARLRVIHVWSHPASSGPGDMQPLVYDPKVLAEEELAAMRESLTAWQERFPRTEVVTEVVHGRPARILSGASARADLLVVGTRGRGGFTGLLLGSVSHALLHHAHCPLAVIPSAGTGEKE